jgi:SecD/SecF fusion protein
VDEKSRLTDALGKEVFPIDAKTPWPDGWTPPDAADNTGGCAVILNNINPQLSPKQIHDRLVNQWQQMQGENHMLGYREFKVEAPSGDDQPTSTAVVMVNDPTLPADKDADAWQLQVAGPTWKCVNDGIDRQGDLRKVSNFDASVAGNTRRDALVALTLSIVIIMAYIWIRFGNLKYGTATVVALLHDTLFTIAALGFAHYIDPEGFIGKILEIEPFRINLTVVAGILTIMGYSMIDTIVVFDRIRENRGKYGHLDAQVINDAVNQTLSRTLLTCGTTTVTVAFMYFLGGAGIHGFTFVLLVGILVGTYSSIAIAAPILLIGNKKEATTPGRSQRLGQLQQA